MTVVPSPYAEVTWPAKEIVRFLYRRHDEFQILLLGNQGSCYDDTVSWFADLAEEHYGRLSEHTMAGQEAPLLTPFMRHWIAYTLVNTFVHLLTHEKDEQKARKEIEQMTRYFMFGWNGMFQAHGSSNGEARATLGAKQTNNVSGT